MRKRYALMVGIVGLLSGLASRSYAQLATAVDVSFSDPAGSVVTVGSTFTVSVLAQILPLPSADDGIFVFSQNLVATNLIPGTSPAFSVISVTRPNTDDTDFGGSNGTDSTSPTGDLLVSGIYGGYLSDSVAVSSPATLYTVTLKALAPGAISISDSAGTAPGYFTSTNADGFQLNDFSYPTAVYPAGPVITAVAAPEPALGLTAVAMSLLANRRRRRACGQV